MKKKNTNKLITSKLIPIFMLLIAGFTYADDGNDNQWYFTTSIALGYQNLDFESDFETPVQTIIISPPGGSPSTIENPPSKTNLTYDESYAIAEFSLGAVYGNYYFAGSYDSNIQTLDDVEITSTQTIPTNPANNNSSTRNANFDREDWSLTAGWNISDTFGIFAGYKYGNTEGPSSTFEASGPYIGAKYNINIPVGYLTISAAYADLDGDFFSRGATGDPVVLDASLNYKGNSQGLSFSASWQYPVGDNWGIGIVAKYQNYDFDLNGTAIQTVQLDPAIIGIPITVVNKISKLKTQETISSLRASIFYQF